MVVSPVAKSLETKQQQKETGNHTHKETSGQSCDDASKASSHLGENDQNNISRNKIHNPNNDNIISIIYKKRIHTMVITIIVILDPTIPRTILMPIITRDEQTRCADGMRRRDGGKI